MKLIRSWFFKFLLKNLSLDDVKKELETKTKAMESWSLLAEKKRKIEEIEKHRLKLKWADCELKKERKRLARIGAEEITDSFVFI